MRRRRVGETGCAWALTIAAFALAGCAPESSGGIPGVPAEASDAAAKKPGAEAAPIVKSFVPRLLRIGESYSGGYTQLSTGASWAPVDCRMPGKLQPFTDTGTASGPHGRKLYFLYAYNEVTYRKGGTQPVGQTIVKEAWHPRRERPGEKPLGIRTSARMDGKTYVPGEKGPLFVMTKLAPETPDTDGGWVYATLDPEGKQVTSAGRIASCMGCHEKGTQDRLFRPITAWRWDSSPEAGRSTHPAGKGGGR